MKIYGSLPLRWHLSLGLWYVPEVPNNHRWNCSYKAFGILYHSVNGWYSWYNPPAGPGEALSRSPSLCVRQPSLGRLDQVFGLHLTRRTQNGCLTGRIMKTVQYFCNCYHISWIVQLLLLLKVIFSITLISLSKLENNTKILLIMLYSSPPILPNSKVVTPANVVLLTEFSL